MRDAAGNVQRVLVLGGTSQIAEATVLALAGQRAGVQVTLAARPGDRRAAVGRALVDRGLVVDELDLEARQPDSYEQAVTSAFDGRDDIDVVIVAFGVLGDQEKAWQDLGEALNLVEVNYAAAVGCGVLVAERLRAQGHGVIVALSSVAGELPRRSNFVYGSSKAGMDAFYQGLGEAVAADGVRVLVVRPGFVTSRMTAGLDPAPLAQDPAQVAAAIVTGLRRGKRTVWVPSSLRWVMSGLRHLPRAAFRRLPL